MKLTSALPLVAERPLYFRTGLAGGADGGTTVVGATTTSRQWLFAEGTVRPGFQEYLTLQNPGGADTVAIVSFQVSEDGGAPVAVPDLRLSLAARSRATVDVNAHVAKSPVDVSMKVVSDLPVVAERPLYFATGLAGGSDGGTVIVGATDASTSFYFAEGTVRPGFQEYLTLQNPANQDTIATVVFQASDDTGAQVLVPDLIVPLPPSSRVTRDISAHVNREPTDVSMRVTSGRPIVAERPLYFNTGLAGGVDGGTDVLGTRAPAPEYFFAEGTVRPGFQQYLTIQNPGDQPTTAAVTFQAADDGGAPLAVPDLAVSLPPRSRVTRDIAAHVTAATPVPANVSMRVRAGLPVVAERPLYFRSNLLGGVDGGHDVIGFTGAATALDIPPVASAGPNQSVPELATVKLDARGSLDPEGRPLTFSWVQTGGPQVALTGSDTSTPSFVAPDVGLGEVALLSFAVTANDGTTAAGAGTSVAVFDPRRPPVADALIGGSSAEGEVARLDGSGSADPNGGHLVFAWQQTGGPLASFIGSTGTPAVDVRLPAVGPASADVAFRLTVRDPDGLESSASVTTTVTNVNRAPTFAAGAGGRTLPESTFGVFTLPIATDPDGDTVSYSMTQTAGPPAAGLVLTATTVSFTAPRVGRAGAPVTLALTASDGLTATVLAVTVDVANVDAPPVARASAMTGVIGTRVHLSALDSTDPDDDGLVFSWQQTGGPSVTLNGATTAEPSFVVPAFVAPGQQMRFGVTVTEVAPAAYSSMAVATVTAAANTVPVARAGPDQTVDALIVPRQITTTIITTPPTVTLDGSLSTDPDNQPLAFRWIQVAGAAVTLTVPASPVTQFAAPPITTDTVLTFRLAVSDSVATVTDVVDVRLNYVNLPPRVQPFVLSGVPDPGSNVILDAGASDGGPLRYQWRSLTRPDLVLNGPTDRRMGFEWPADDPQQMAFETTVTDTDGAAVTTRTVVQNEAPPPLTATIAGPSFADPGQVVTLTGTASRPGAQFAWSQVAGPAGLFAGPIIRPTVTFTVPSADSGANVTLRVRAQTGDGPIEATHTIAVRPPPVVADAGGDKVAITDQVGVTLSASGSGAGALAYMWSQVSGASVSLSGANTAVARFTAPRATGALVFQLTVTDTLARSATDRVTINVIAPPSPRGLLCDLADRVAAGARLLTFEVNGYVSFEATATAVAGNCLTEATITITGGTLTLFDVIRGQGITGTITTEGVCVGAATLALPEDWKVPPFAIEQSVCHPFSGNQPKGKAGKDGKATTNGFPRLPPGRKVRGKAMSLIFGDEPGIGIAASATIGASTVASVTGTIERTLDFDLTVQVTDVIRVANQSMNLSGHLARANGRIVSSSVSGSIGRPELTRTTSDGLADLIPGLPGLRLEHLAVAWGDQGFTATARAWVGRDLRLAMSGSVDDDTTWTVFARMDIPGGWTPVPGLTVGSVSGSLGRLDGNTKVDFRALVAEWQVVPGVVTLRDLDLHVVNPTPSSLGVELSATGALTGAGVALEFGGRLTIPGGRFDLTATAGLDNWEVVPGTGVYLDQVKLAFGYSPGGVIGMTATATSRVFGKDVTAIVVLSQAGVIVDLGLGSFTLLPGITIEESHLIFSNYGVDYSYGAANRAGPAEPVAPGDPVNIPLEANTLTLAGTYPVPDPIEDFLGVGQTVASVRGKASLDLSALDLRASITTSAYVLGDATSNTSLKLTSAFVEIAATGVGIGATADLVLPDNPGVLTLEAKLAFDFQGPAIRGSFGFLGDWVEPFGVDDLILADGFIQFGINFGTAPPTPTFGLGLRVKQLPPSIVDLLGLRTEDTHTIVVNLSATQPVFSLQLGAKDGIPSLRPGGAGFEDFIALDFADFVVAPRGGTLGPYVFQPGISLRFAAQILGITVDFDARATGLTPPATPRFSARASFGRFNLGGLEVSGTIVTIEISPAFPVIPSVGFAGSIRAPGGFTLELAGGLSAGGEGIRFHMLGRLRNLSFGGVTVRDIHAGASFLRGQSSASAAVVAGAVIDLFGTDLTVDGAFEVAGGSAVGLQARVQVSPVTVVPGIRVTSAGTPSAGPTLDLDWDGTTFVLGVDGAVRAAGFAVEVTGVVDSVHATLTATVTAGSLIRFAATGDLFYGNPAGLLVRRVGGGTTPAQPGDFYFASRAAVTLPVPGYSIAASVEVGRSAAVVSGRGGADLSAFGRTLAVLGSFSGNGQFALTVNATNLLGFGETSALSVSNTGVSLGTSFGLAGFTAVLSGQVQNIGGVTRYSLNGTGSFAAAPFSTTATFALSNYPGRGFQGLRVALTVKLGSVVNVALAGSLPTNGDYSFTAAGSLTVPGLSAAASFTLTRSRTILGSPGPPLLELDTAFSASGIDLSFRGRVGFDGTFSLAADLEFSGRSPQLVLHLDEKHYVFLDADLRVHAELRNTSFGFDISGTFRIREYRKSYVPGSNKRGPFTLFSVSGVASTNPLKACASAHVFGATRSFCTPALS